MWSSPPRKRARSELPDAELCLPSPAPSPPSPALLSADGGGPDAALGLAGSSFHGMGGEYGQQDVSSLQNLVAGFGSLSASQQTSVLYHLLRQTSRPVLHFVDNLVSPSLRHDFFRELPPEIVSTILSYLDTRSLCRAARVCKGWRWIVDSDWKAWRDRMVAEHLWKGDGSEEREVKEVLAERERRLASKRTTNTPSDSLSGRTPGEGRMRLDGDDNATWTPTTPPSIATTSSQTCLSDDTPLAFVPASPQYPHPLKTVYRRRRFMREAWLKHEPICFRFQGSGPEVVTCLQFDEDKIVSASDEGSHSIDVFEMGTGRLRHRLRGHEGGVWALQYLDNILVSGSTDRTLRVWDLASAKCTHVFKGHTSTIRCLQIVLPTRRNGRMVPDRPLVVTGSRDATLGVWILPTGADQPNQPLVLPRSENRYHVRTLTGHLESVRALHAQADIVASGSYDCTVRIWNLITGEELWTLRGHSQRVYSVQLDLRREQCCSGSLDSQVRVWSIETGQCLRVLAGHQSLVGLLSWNHSFLASAAADSTLRIWDPDTGRCRKVLWGHTGPITCFQTDEHKIISGSEGVLKQWNVKEETSRQLLDNLAAVWQLSFNDRYVIAAVQRASLTWYEIFDYGPVDEERFQESPLHDDPLPPALRVSAKPPSCNPLSVDAARRAAALAQIQVDETHVALEAVRISKSGAGEERGDAVRP